jgi:hypothetical protein
MDDFLDSAWELIAYFLNNMVVYLDTLLSPLEIFGPGPVIFLLAFLVVCITRIIAKFYVTKRYIELKKEFEHWYSIREEAMNHPDKEKGKALAKNIDQAQLNKAYYDFFFEGLLKHFITNLLPILMMVSYVTTVYTPETLFKRFGTKWVYSISFGSSSQIHISSFFWFIICLFLSFILFMLLKKCIRED